MKPEAPIWKRQFLRLGRCHHRALLWLLAVGTLLLITHPKPLHSAEPSKLTSTRENATEPENRGTPATAVLRDGTRREGTLLVPQMVLKTPYGTFAFPVGDLRTVRCAQTTAEADVVETVRGDRISGSLEASQFAFRSASGETLSLGRTELECIHLAQTPRTPSPSHPAQTSSDFPQSAQLSAPPLPQNLSNLVWIPPGRFTIGSPEDETGRDFDEGPRAEIAVPRGFWMGRCEVTQAEYQSISRGNPSSFVGDPQRPVEKVNWREATSYCERLTKLHTDLGLIPAGYAYRLPSEAEWEYACRAGSSTRFFYGNDEGYRKLGDYAWYGDNSDSSTQPVGRKLPNAWGLYDICGNVLEWCQDVALSSLPGNSVEPPANPTGSTLRVARGGSWLYGAKASRSANRDSYAELTRCSDLGFRVVLAPIPDEAIPIAAPQKPR